ncbi:MAG: ornithine carbamoyltransferase [Gemmatimonadota bacterium]
MTASDQHFTEIQDLPPRELAELLDEGRRLKRPEVRRSGRCPLEGKSLAMIFRKSSTRTRVSFEVGMHELGGHAVFLADRDSQIGRAEPLADAARVLSGYVDGIMIRTFSHDDVRELARHASVPVINGLSDLLHPCQILADLLTVMEEYDLSGDELSGLRVGWVGDGNNVANSWINAAAAFGLEVTLACPSGYEPDEGVLEAARDRGAHVRLVADPEEAVEGARVVTTDVWASMGQEAEQAVRLRAFQGYQVDEALISRAADDAIFLHCLPAHRGEEVTEEVLEGGRSRVFREAENRLHAQKALLIRLMGSSTR